ncbi:hypothetical protein N431DRAFT_462868 [Stipitochalara longipes BDJ]|nr:hypothetical protein N431DRAFT_462868 [Stipitochalara longipes BDJ]
MNTVMVPSFAFGECTACRIHIGATNIAMPIPRTMALTRRSDKANHTVLCLRQLLPLLLEDTVRFEQQFIVKKIAQGNFDLTKAHAWYETTKTLQNPYLTLHKSIWSLFEGSVNLIMPGCSTKVPRTLLFDEVRLIKLRDDMLDAINMEICLNLWKAVQASGRVARLKLFASKLQKKKTPSPEESIRKSLMDLVDGSASIKRDKWRDVSKPLALEILRSTQTKTETLTLTTFESHLASHLSNSESPAFKRCKAITLSRLFPVLKKLVDMFLPLSNERLFEAATTRRPHSPVISGEREEIVDIASRLAHIGILHWRVWSNIAYLVDPDTHGLEESEA